MKKITALITILFLIHFSTSADIDNSDIRTLSGNFISIHNGIIEMQTAPGVTFHVPVDSKMKLVSPLNSAFYYAWLSKGDGITLTLRETGSAVKATVYVAWYSGTVAFVSPDRLTFLEGNQFFTSPAPVHLNGKIVPDPTFLKVNEQVLVRFDTLHNQVTGVWAYDRDKLTGELRHIFKANAEMTYPHPRKPFLKIRAKATPHGKLFASIPGVLHKTYLQEISPGYYERLIPVPNDIIIHQCFLQIQWNGSEKWIPRDSISIFTEPPSITDVEPPDGSEISINPPLIFSTLDPEKTPLDPETIHFFLDGENITHQCYRDTNLIFFSPEKPLSPGKHACLFLGKSKNGGYDFQKKWSFTLKE